MNAVVNNAFNFQTTEDYQCLVDENHKFYNSDYKCWYGGRASAKSTQLARGAIYRSWLKPMKILCTREYQNSIKDSILALLSNQIYILGLQDYFEIQKQAIFGKNGTEFIFKGLSLNSSSIRSMEGIDLCLIMEAQYISDNSFTDLLPTIRENNSEIWLEWNPYSDSDPVHQRFIVNPPPDSYICNVNFRNNPWLSDKSLRTMEYDKQRNYELYLHVWEGKTLKLTESLVFKHYKIDGSIEPKESDVLYYGSDFGFSVDPTTLIRLWIDDKKRELYIDHEVYDIGVEIDDIPALYDKIPGARKWTITADSARPETISYLKRQGFKMRASKKGAGSVKEGVKFLQSYDIVIHPRCKQTISEFGSYSWKVDKLTNEILPILNDSNNHIIDACRYALEKLFNYSRIYIG